jgi:hypothetical protein
MLACVDTLLDPLQKSIERVLGKWATPTDLERQTELRRSALRVILHFRLLEGIQSSAPFKDFYDNFVSKNQTYVEILSALQNEYTAAVNLSTTAF